jgi:hypothetical protein
MRRARPAHCSGLEQYGRASSFDLPYGQIPQRSFYGAPLLRSRAIRRRGERDKPLSASHSETENLRTLTAVIDMSAHGAESALGVLTTDANAWLRIEQGGGCIPISA